MSPERWREVEEFTSPLWIGEPRQRAAFRSEACGGGEDLRREVNSLLDRVRPEYSILPKGQHFVGR
jgi:hypothetical protein